MATKKPTTAEILRVADFAGKSTDELLGYKPPMDASTAYYCMDTTLETLCGLHSIISTYAAAGYEESPALGVVARALDECVVDLGRVKEYLEVANGK